MPFGTLEEHAVHSASVNTCTQHEHKHTRTHKHQNLVLFVGPRGAPDGTNAAESTQHLPSTSTDVFFYGSLNPTIDRRETTGNRRYKFYSYSKNIGLG